MAKSKIDWGSKRMTARMDSLIGNSYSIVKFADLPKPYQKAMIWFMAIDGCAWDGIDISELYEDDVKLAFPELIPQYVELYGDTLFGIVNLSATDLKSSVMLDEELSGEHASWKEYHAWYGGGTKHPELDRWPVILSSEDFETLRDGWHRFHGYIRDGAVEIPALFYPLDHHKLARGMGVPA
jgi:hypothetical protein